MSSLTLDSIKRLNSLSVLSNYREPPKVALTSKKRAIHSEEVW